MNIPEAPQQICEQLQHHGHKAFLVGGAVRDTLMGRVAHDWDIATSVRPEAVMAMFPRVVATGLQHGTVSVIVKDVAYEVTTFRSDGDYSDGRRPDGVTFVKTIEEDLARRDFTVNAIALDPVTGGLVDPYDGQRDIEMGLIRCVGVPKFRFEEDGLRLMRAARFAATLGFTIHGYTMLAMTDSAHMIERVAVERIQAELVKAIMAPVPSVAFGVLAEATILERIVPEFAPMYGCKQNRYHGYDVFRHSMEVLNCTPPDLIVRLASLFHDVDKPTCKGVHPKHGDVTFYNHEDVGAKTTDEIMMRLKFPTETRQRVVHLVRHHLVKYERGWAASAIRRWVRKIGRDNLDQLMALARADILGKGPAEVPLDVTLLDHLAERIAGMEIGEPIATSTTQLAINGGDVMAALGIPPGKAVGDKLRELLDLVTEQPELNTREALLEALGQPAALDAAKETP
jgi:tRNA nucleotidyltransferase (CCA-adding enzyme)